MEAAQAKWLIQSALQARERAYAPYSNFFVGAALLTESGEIFQGCNVECASYGATCCAERSAVVSAVSQGHRRFRAIAIVGYTKGETPEPQACFPCGICRQMLLEFCDADRFEVLVQSPVREYESYTLAQLLPHAFGSGQPSN